MIKFRSEFRSQLGFTYIEIIITIAVITVSLVPIMDSIRTSTLSSEHHQSHVVQQWHNFGKMEEVLAEPFARLSEAAEEAGGNGTTPTNYSDDEDTDVRGLVYLSHYDVDGDGNQDLVVKVKTMIEGSDQTLESLVVP